MLFEDCWLLLEPMKMEKEIGATQKFLRKAGEGAWERVEASKQLARWAPNMMPRIGMSSRTSPSRISIQRPFGHSAAPSA